MIDILQKLCSIPCVAGNEEAMRDFIVSQIRPYVSRVEVDTLGNLLAFFGDGEPEFVIECGMDECGVMAVGIEESGIVRVAAVGGVKAENLLNREIRLSQRPGVVRCDKTEKIDFTGLYVDLGFDSREEAEKAVKIGDMAVLENDFRLTGNYAMSSSVSVKSPIAIMIDIIKNIQTDKNVCFLFSAQKQLGSKGLKAAMGTMSLDTFVGISCAADDAKSDIKLGKGPAVVIKEGGVLADSRLKTLLTATAEKAAISYQLYIGDESSGLKAAIAGTPKLRCGAVLLPVKYKGLPLEKASLADMENVKKLLVNFINEYGADNDKHS